MSKEILAKFDAATQEFCTLAKSVNIYKLHAAPSEGEWSAAFVIHHLADSDSHFVVRFLNVLSEDSPQIVPFNEESFPKALRYESRSIAISLNAIEAARAHVVDLLSHIDDASWNRSGFHSERGEMTLTAILELTTKHRLDHIEQLHKLVAKA
jgi:uncharacterized damage-inducible protein DinB